MASIVRVVVFVIALAAIRRGSGDNTEDMAIRYLQRYGYLNDSIQTFSESTAPNLRHAIALFQEYYRLPGDGTLNNETLRQMRKPRCGVEDISDFGAIKPVARRWPRTRLTWNFHLAQSEILLRLTKTAFDLWAANSSLQFERDVLHPDIVISFQRDLHSNINVERNSAICREPFDGPGNILAHATLPSGWDDFVSEIHVDRAEPWYIYLDVNPENTQSLLQTLTHEIGHSLGLSHNTRNDSVMFAFSPDNRMPVRLSVEDVLNIRQLYGDRNDVELPKKPTTTPETPTTTTTTTRPVPKDLCALRRIDGVLIMNKRMYVAHERHVWSIDIDGKTYDKPLLLTDYMKFIPENFTRLWGAYQNSFADIVLFVDRAVYKVRYPTFEIVPTWPKTLENFGLPPDAKINAAINTNRGRSFVIYNNHAVGEIDECVEKIVKHHNIETLFPGIPPGIKSAFRYIDGNLYFVDKRQFYKFNEFIEAVTEVGKFDLRIVNVVCPKDGLLRQLRDLLDRFVRISADEKQPEEEEDI